MDRGQMKEFDARHNAAMNHVAAAQKLWQENIAEMRTWAKQHPEDAREIGFHGNFCADKISAVSGEIKQTSADAFREIAYFATHPNFKQSVEREPQMM